MFQDELLEAERLEAKQKIETFMIQMQQETQLELEIAIKEAEG